MMKILYLLPFFLILTSCSLDEDRLAVINGRVERAINGEGVPGQKVTVMTRKSHGSGMFASTRELDSKEVTTDANGNFSVALKNAENAFVTTTYLGDDDYSGFGAYKNHFIDEPIVLKVDKFVKFKIVVQNTDPYNEDDYINIDLFAALQQVKRTKIENFGVANIHYPEEPLPGGGLMGAYDVAAWKGTNVNSIVYYSAAESADFFKIRWFKEKNGIKTDGLTDDIPYDSNQVNTFIFEY